MVTINEKNVVNHIMEYEGGNPTMEEFLKLFAYLIKTGRVWSLQGTYGRQAKALIENGLISKEGRVQWKKAEEAGIDKKDTLYASVNEY